MPEKIMWLFAKTKKLKYITIVFYRGVIHLKQISGSKVIAIWRLTTETNKCWHHQKTSALSGESEHAKKTLEMCKN